MPEKLEAVEKTDHTKGKLAHQHVSEQQTRGDSPTVQPATGNLAIQRMVRTGPLVQRAPVNEGNPSTATAPETPSPDQALAAPSLIVDDPATDLEPGQMRKSDFLAQLRGAVCQTADEALAGTIWSTVGCPYISRWFDHYAQKDSAYIERAIRKYAPETAASSSISRTESIRNIIVTTTAPARKPNKR